MTSPVAESALLVGILRRLSDVVGERAATSLVQYGAAEEARSRYSDGGPGVFPVAVASIGSLLRVDVRLLEDGPSGAVLEVTPKGLGGVEGAIALGLAKGAFLATHHARDCEAALDDAPEPSRIFIRRTS